MGNYALVCTSMPVPRMSTVKEAKLFLHTYLAFCKAAQQSVGVAPSACGTYHSLRSGTMSPKWARGVAVGMGSWAADLGEEVAGLAGIGAAAISPLPSAASILNSLGGFVQNDFG